MNEESESPRRSLPEPDAVKREPPPAPPPPDTPPETPSQGTEAGEIPGTAPPLEVRVRPEPEDEGEVVASDDASLQDRIIAAAIDLVLATGLYLGARFLLPGLLDHASYGLWIAYMLTRDSLPFLDGQSVGKKARRIRAVTRDGAGLSGNWQAGVVRNVVLLIPLFPLVELFVLISRHDGPKPLLRLGDEWAGTKVVTEAATETPGPA